MSDEQSAIEHDLQEDEAAREESMDVDAMISACTPEQLSNLLDIVDRDAEEWLRTVGAKEVVYE